MEKTSKVINIFPLIAGRGQNNMSVMVSYQYSGELWMVLHSNIESRIKVVSIKIIDYYLSSIFMP